ncbi:MAG: PQQ-like beta-propeller repeat protein [Sedimentisphaerales bacterium]|nr:PQQ-like beta-propeller repeat protein [Sedimentisphaerales bacterium]
MKKLLLLSLLLLLVMQVNKIFAADCPRFRGPSGDGIFPETGLLKKWPDGGPKLAWSVKGLGQGFSSAVVVDGTVYVTGMDEQKQGYLFAYNLDGSLRWKAAYGPEIEKMGSSVAGTRGTPTVDSGQIFVMSSFAKLYTIETKKGKVIRVVDLLERFGARQARFGFAECVIVDNDKVICTPGGPDATLVALNKKTGELIWQTKGLSDPTGYCSARIVRHGGRRLLITMVANGIVAINPDNGELLWRQEHSHRAGVQPNPPVYSDGMIYFSSGMGAGGVMLELADDGLSVTPKWEDKMLDCQMHGVVLVDGYIYGAAQGARRGLVCLELKTSNVMWNAAEIGKGSVVCADGMLYIYGEDGTVHLVKPSPEAFKPVSKFTISEGTEQHWAHPTIANGRLYIRHGDTLMAYDIRAGY